MTLKTEKFSAAAGRAKKIDIFQPPIAKEFFTAAAEERKKLKIFSRRRRRERRRVTSLIISNMLTMRNMYNIAVMTIHSLLPMSLQQNQYPQNQ